MPPHAKNARKTHCKRGHLLIYINAKRGRGCRECDRESDRKRKGEKRRAAGAIPRAQYEATGLAHGKPWETIGFSRSTWYRRQREGAPARASAPPDASATEMLTDDLETPIDSKKWSPRKLSAVEVISIREQHAAGVSQRRLARDFGVGASAIRFILTRRTWRHLP